MCRYDDRWHREDPLLYLLYSCVLCHYLNQSGRSCVPLHPRRSVAAAVVVCWCPRPSGCVC